MDRLLLEGKPDVPLKAYADLKAFKVFLLNVGLPKCLSGVSPKVILEGSRIFEEFKGALTEQYVCQELQLFKRLQTNYYWASSSTVEIDFLVSDGLEVYPLECKAGVTLLLFKININPILHLFKINIRSIMHLFKINTRPILHLFKINTVAKVYCLFGLSKCLGEKDVSCQPALLSLFLQQRQTGDEQTQLIIKPI